MKNTLLTPAMNKPNAMPSLLRSFTPVSVGTGSRRLPGASFFVKPSTKITITRVIEEMIPKMDVYDSSESGRNTVGMRL